jgi:DNA polymerase III alpha subunit (gram-positive type)
VKELIVALDRELNQPSGRIVQIGAVPGNVRTGEVVSHFDAKVNPGEPFSSRIAELTGLSAPAFQGRKHNALDDALNTFRMYRALLAEFRKSDSCNVAPVEF